MSWFDSSFSFAKTALSQAQKSIDKVLDINDGQNSSEAALDPTANNGVSTSASVSPPSSTSNEAAPAIKTHGTPDPPSSKSANPLSTWFSPSQEEQSRQSKTAHGNKSTPPAAEKSGSSSVFGSTWGANDSFWGSYFTSPGSSDQGGGGGKDKRGNSEGVKEAPKPTSMARGTGARRLKSQTSSSNKTQSSEQRKRVTSPRLTSPPKSSSTPLPQPKEKEKSTSVENSSDLEPGTSSIPKQPEQAVATPRNSSKSQSVSKTLLKASEGGEGEVTSSEGGAEVRVKAKKPSNQSLKSRATPDLSEPVNDSSHAAAAVLEATDSGITAAQTIAPLTVVEQTALMQEETDKMPDTSSRPLSTQDSKTRDIDSTRKSSSSPESQPTPTAITSNAVGEDTTRVPSQTGNSTGHSAVHRDTQQDSTDTQQAAVKQTPLSDQTLETKSETDSNIESKPREQDNIPVITNEQPHTRDKEQEINTKATETKDSTLHQLQTSPGMSEPERGQSPSSVAIQDKGVGERGQQPPGDDRQKNESTTPKESVGVKESIEHPDIDRLKKELAEIRQVLEVRELKMVEMSRESISLRETNQSLEEELAEAKRTGQTDVDELRSEFTRRLATAEKKFQAVVKERDSLRKQLQALQDEQTQQKQSVGDEWDRMIKEKDEQIAQLMEEGEKLSKQELQSNGIIKKLRQKDKQNDQLLAAQRQQIEDLEGKVKILKEQMKKKEENETKYQESLGQLNTIAEQQAKELASLKAERDELMDKVRSLQTNLDNSYKELAELQKANAVTQSAAQEAALSAEQSAREELKGVLDQQKLGAQREKEALLMQVDELRMSVSRAEQQAAWREDHMRQELADMQQRLQEAESRNQELTSSISQATKPLLRQIENLQAAHSAQSTNWDKIEANLTQRLVQTQAQLGQSSEKERSAVEKEMTLQSRVRALETQLSSTKQEKSQLLATLELERAKLQTLEESQHRESAKTEALRTSCQQSMDELRKEKEMLERQLEYERVRLEAESRKACLESQEKERLRAQLASSLSLNRTVSRQSSTGSQSDILEKSLHAASEGGGSVSDMSLHTSRGGVAPSASLIEQLQSLLKQKEGELANSQNLVGSLERSRAAMAEDLANLSAQNETLKNEVDTIPSLKQKLQEVERKHEAMLQMYGEKAEEAEELKLDIDDLKTMYRQQIEELLGKRR